MNVKTTVAESNNKRWYQRLQWKQAAVGGFLFFFAKGMVWLGIATWVVIEQL